MPVKWYGSLVLICILGVALVLYSRYELQHPSPGVAPTVGSHWYAALGFDVCGTQQPNLPANPTTGGVPDIRTDGDGVIQIAPTSAASAGNNATLGRFVNLYPGLTVAPTSLHIPGKPTYRSGTRCPSGTPQAGRPAQVDIAVWSSFTGPGSTSPTSASHPASVKLADGQLITVAFVPRGTSVSKPSSIVALLNDRAQSGSTSTTVPPTSVPPTTATTTAPATSTTAPSTSTTAR
jgi:hypothetical protein